MLPNNARILVAEDNHINARLIVAVLEKAGYEVTIAVDGERAAALGLAGGFDLVLMDINMPEIDGLEATRRIRAGAAPANGVTIVALTADDDGATQARCAKAGMDGYLCKPIDMSALIRTVERTLNRNRKRSA